MGKIKTINIVLLIMLLLGYNTLHSQTLQGVVVNEQNTFLNNVSVILKSNENKTIAYRFTGADGSFSFTDLEAKEYLLQCNSLGYEKQLITIDLSKEKTKKINIILIEKPEELQEVIIEVPVALKQKKDTVTYNVKSFLDGTEYTVEDLLKKLPGIQVDENGTIKVGNQEIEKIMVEGDDFFEKGYKILSKNMPVKPLKEVELLQNYSNNKHLKGIENSDKVALNLKLEDDAKRQWFGNFDAGYGVASENRYTAYSNLMNFGKKDKYYFLTNLNNIGDDSTGDISHLIRSSNDFVVGDDQMAQQFLSLAPSTASLRDNRTNFNNAEMLSLNSIFTLSAKSKLKAIAFLNTNEQNFYRNSYDWFSDGQTSFENKEDYFMRQKRLSAFGKLDLTHDFSKKSTLEVTTRYNYADNKDRSTINFNDNNLEERLKTTTNFVDSKILYTTKPSDKKVWILAGRFINEATPQNYTVNQFVYQDLFKRDADAVKQNSANTMHFYGFEAKYLDRRPKGHLLEFATGAEFRNDDLNTTFYLIDNQAEIRPDDFQNNLKFQNYSYYTSLNYSYRLWNNFRIASSVKLNYLSQKIEGQQEVKKNDPFLLTPSLNFTWEINNKNKLQAGYNYNMKTNNLLNMYPNYLHTGFRNFTTGYTDFVKFANHSSSLMYSFGNFSDRFFMSAMAGYGFSDEYFSSQTILAQNYTVSTPIVLKDQSMIYYNLNTDYYFKPIKTNMKIVFGGTSSQYQNYVNESDIRDITSTSINYGMELRSGFSGIFNYHFGTKWDYNKFETTNVFDYTNNRTFVNLNFRFSKKLYAVLQSERYYFGNLSQNKKDFYFSDLNIDYRPNEKISLRFAVNNIFNTDTFVSYSLTDISISETNYKLIPRYALLRAEFRF
ncbi:DUF2012 domain-containing protein [Myroides ceti]|uniref:DUF2012 domain-containing protein n=1 Tax=Paenimyroides ceti TaxID=395087 RepID=A0ABT8CTA3_9FLAO|nr:DUF2012 domain-containing protein [Paenimyroides ceti]MDN3706782.1 DUF2012 domain-containing protein [Paenimyroides ceti]